MTRGNDFAAASGGGLEVSRSVVTERGSRSRPRAWQLPGPRPARPRAMRGGGFILYYRHADTDHRENDAPMQSMEGCANQANLTERGREHVRAIGEAIRALGTPIGPVLTSPMCRTMETAMLTFGRPARPGGARRG